MDFHAGFANQKYIKKAFQQKGDVPRWVKKKTTQGRDGSHNPGLHPTRSSANR